MKNCRRRGELGLSRKHVLELDRRRARHLERVGGALGKDRDVLAPNPLAPGALA